ncbi:MAG: protoheme IX farnesyltransferase [Rhodobacteraceae bacterium]|nr:protoheme IX farnesyltransferase [Paracoccaceae bacterium]
MTDATYTDTREYEAQFGDYVELLKPRVMRLVIFTAAVGLFAAPSAVHPVIAFASILCIAVGAGASGALNMWWDRDIDAIMKRTAGRPIPSGRIQPNEALAIGLTLSFLSVMMLGLFANLAAAGLLAFTIFFYAVVYSMWLKRATPQNIVIGGAAGAFPPMIGWVVATGSIGVEAVLMFLLILIWTPPHFWALALWRNEDYKAAKIPMLPVTHGTRVTRRHILAYTLVLIPIAIAPAFTQIGGSLYFGVSVVLNLIFLWGAVHLFRRNDEDTVVDDFRAEKRFFAFTILYLFLHFVTLLVVAALRAYDLHLGSFPVWF